MAQLIRKYQGGGTTKSQVTSPPKTYPTILVDGKEIELTEDLQNWVRQHAASIGGNAGYWVGEHLNSALTGGAKVDTGTHTIESNIDYDSLNAAQQRRMGKLVRRSSKKLGDAKQGTYEFIEALRSYTPKKDSIDHSDELIFEYEIDDKGNYKLDSEGNKILLNSADSSNALTRLLSLPDILARQDDFDFTGYNGQSLTNYRDWYNNYTSEGLKALESRIRTGTYTDADVAVLSDLGYILGKAGSQKKTPGKENVVIPERYSEVTTWNPADWLEAGYAKKGDDGYLYITDEGAKVFGAGNQWLNDSFLIYNPAAKSYVPSGKGLFIIDNRIYNADDSDLRNQKTYIDFVNANKAFKYSDANNIIKQYHHVGSGPSYRNLVADPQTGNRLYSHALGSEDIYGRNSTNEYSPVYDANGKQLLVYEYFDRDATNDPKLYDEFGHADANRLSAIAIDPDTGQKVEVDPSNFKRLDVPKDYGIKGNIYSPYYQLAEGLNLIKPYGEVTGANWNYYYDPETGVYYYQSNETWPDRSDLLSNEFAEAPSQFLHRIPPEWVEFIKNNPEALKDSEVRELLMYVLQNPYLDKANAYFWPDKVYDKYPQLPRTDHDAIRGTYRKNNVPEGYLIPLTPQVPLQAQGGILKAQLGARMSAADSVNLVAKEKVETAGPNKKIRAYGTEKVLGDETELTDADWWDIAALGADTVGLVLGYIPMAHYVGAAAGLIGSLAGFGADVERDGFQWGDLGELGLNVGMDVGSLFAGSLAKTKKIANAASGIKKLAPKLLKLVNLAGMGAGMQTAIESFQNDSWTIDDLRTVVNGLGSIRNLRRTITPKTKTDVNEITLKHKTDPSLNASLTKQEVDHINSLPEGQRAKALNDLLAAKTGQNAEIKKYQAAEKEFNALVETNKAEAAKKGSETELWDEAEIAKTKKEFYESKGLDVNKTVPTVTHTDYEGIDFRPNREHWYSLSLPGKAPKINIETTQKVPLTTDGEYESAWDNVRQWLFKPALKVNNATATLSDLGISSPRQARANKPVKVSKPKEVKTKPAVVEKPTEVPEVPQERVDYLNQLQAQRSLAKAPTREDILSLNEEELRRAVDEAKTKKQRQRANSLLNDYLVAKAKDKRKIGAFIERQKKIENEIATIQGQIEARKAYEEKVAEYAKSIRDQHDYDAYVKAQTDYEKYERDKKAQEAAKLILRNRIVLPHLFVNDPYRRDPVYSKPQPGYYVYYKEGGKIKKGRNGLPPINKPKYMWEEKNPSWLKNSTFEPINGKALLDEAIKEFDPDYIPSSSSKLVSEQNTRSLGQIPSNNVKTNNLNWLDPVLMAAEFGNAQYATKKIGELNKKALQSQFESQLKTPFREDSPVRTNVASVQYSQLNDQLLKNSSRMGHTSDAGINLAQDLAIQEQANDLRTKGWNAMREEDLNYRTAAWTTSMKNKLSEHEAGQNNFTVGKMIESGKYSQDASTNKQLKDNETALLAEIRNNIKSDRLRQSQYDSALKSQELSNIHQSILNEYSRLSDDIKARYLDAEDYWAQKYPDSYKQYKRDRIALKYDASGAMNYPFLFNNSGKNRFGRVKYSKSGGKASSFYLPEKMILQNQKDNTKAFLKSKDNLLKILLKLMK